MRPTIKKALLAAGAAALAATLTVAWVYRWYWRDAPARYLPFTRAWLYPSPVDDARLAGLRDRGRGVVIESSGGFRACERPVEPVAPATGGHGIEARLVVRAQKAVGVAFRCGSDVPYVAEQNGKILPVIDGELGPPLLDLTMKLFRPPSGTRDWEQGLQAIAFSPDDRYLYVTYTDPEQATRLSEFELPREPRGTIDPADERVVLAVAQPHNVHNGGALEFGPDGYLYVGVGDGGLPCGAMNAFGRRLYGKVLRIDPRAQPEGSYGIPQDNPFVGAEPATTPRAETWVWGVRNPWGLFVDPRDGAMWIADVGENGWEEINVVRKADSGVDLGWPIFEGPTGPREPCVWEAEAADVTTEPKATRSGPFHEPFHAYRHVPVAEPAARCSVTGGEVYLGSIYPELVDTFLFGDLCSGELLAVATRGGEPIDTGVRIGLLTSIVVDHLGYIWTTGWDGAVHRLEPTR